MAINKQEQLLMIPGPHQVDPTILETLAIHPVSHVSPSFISEFGECLNNFNFLLGGNNESQPFIISGGGSVGWDCVISSLCEYELNDQALILNAGVFSDRFEKTCKAYNISTDTIKAKCIGDVVTSEQLKEYFTNPNNADIIKKLKLVFIVHVDTSTAVCCDIKSLSWIIHKYAPNTFIVIDGICSCAAEEFQFSEWGIDAAITASQKAFGLPPGLCMLILSKRAINYMCNDRRYRIHSYYTNLLQWLPVMRAYQNNKRSYFSTPNMNLIRALNKSCRFLIDEGIENVVLRHKKFSNIFRSSLKSIGLQFVPIRDDICSSTVSAIKYPKGINGEELLKIINTETDVMFAVGIHPIIRNTHFRVGHMGISTQNGSNNILKCIQAIEYGLKKCGYNFEKGAAINTFHKLTLKARL